MSTHGPIEPAVAKVMNDIGRLIGSAIKQRGGNYGFALLMFGFGPEAGRMNYISNAQRTEMLTAMKEFIARAEGFDPPLSETKQ